MNELRIALGGEFLRLRGVWDNAVFPLFLLVVGAYGLITLPLGNSFSRWLERRADAYALKATGKGQPYASP